MEPRQPFLLRLSNLLFYIYIITLYLFVLNTKTIVISQLAFVAFAGVTAFYLLAKGQFHLGKSVAFAYLTCGWIFATVLWAYSRHLAGIKIKTLWQIFILFFLVYNLYCTDKNAHKKLVKALYAAGIAFCLYTVYTYGLSGMIEALTGGEMTRLGRDINQENIFGMQHATTAVIAIFYLLYFKKHKGFHTLVLVFSFICAMSSGSRKALLIVILGGMYLIYKRYGIRQLYKTVFVGIVAGVVFSAAIQLPMFETVRVRMEQGINTYKGESGGDSSSQLRMRYVSRGWNLFLQRPIHGYGADNFAVASGMGTYAHNNFTEMLVDFGLVGFLLYYAMYIISYKRLKKNRDNYAIFLFVLLMVRTAMEIAMVTYYDKLHWILLAFFMIDPANFEQAENNEIEIK